MVGIHAVAGVAQQFPAFVRDQFQRGKGFVCRSVVDRHWTGVARRCCGMVCCQARECPAFDFFQMVQSRIRCGNADLWPAGCVVVATVCHRSCCVRRITWPDMVRTDTNSSGIYSQPGQRLSADQCATAGLSLAGANR